MPADYAQQAAEFIAYDGYEKIRALGYPPEQWPDIWQRATLLFEERCRNRAAQGPGHPDPDDGSEEEE